MSSTPAAAKTFQYLNVILHGAFAYVFDDDAIRVFTPACFGHSYEAGGLTSQKELCRGAYRLEGIRSSNPPHRTISPNPNTDPVISLKDARIDRKAIDSFAVSYCRFEFPYPAERQERPTLMHSALHACVGEIYSGQSAAANPLNALDSVPSMHMLVYEISDQQNCGLVPVSSTDPKCTTIHADEASTSDPDNTLNFHIFCTRNDMQMQGMPGMSADGHVRMAFSGVIGLLGGLELFINFPNRFDPAPSSTPPALPIGVVPGDLEPTAHNQPMFGKVNCQYSDLLLIP